MNRLQFEKSPYLLQHAHQPVDWYPWGAEAFDTALREDKPVFLSIGYAACHWCHVMAHESFDDPDVAAFLSEHFISIKVDREERPDVDSVYMAACAALTGNGGWPLTVLLTPEQKPFWAGTYLKQQQLLYLLAETVRLWRGSREKITTSSERLTGHLQGLAQPEAEAPARELCKRGLDHFSRSYDATWGGFGAAPKFPSAHNLLFLLEYHRRTGDADALRMAEGTLEHMARGGIFDHVGGGFSRYSTDGKWLAPHFEKMLYDNALLALAYTEAYRETRQVWCADVARRVLDYALRELRNPQGGFGCAQDADSAGVEGKFYLFTRQELDAVLGPDAPEFARRYGVTQSGNFHGKCILNLIGNPDWQHASDGMVQALAALENYRKARTSLLLDDKVLTSWNGLMIAALARAGALLGEDAYLDAAKAAVQFIETHLRGEHGALLARWRDGDAAHPAKLEDFAFLAWGMLELYAAAFNPADLALAIALADELLARFFDHTRGGFYPYASDGEQLITRTKDVYDGALPSGNAAAALVLSRLSRLTGEERFRKAAEKQLCFLAGAIRQHPEAHSFTLLTLMECLWDTEELVVCAKALPAALTEYLRAPHPGLTALLKTPETAPALEALAPFTKAYPIPDDGALYYRCHGGTCERPTESL